VTSPQGSPQTSAGTDPPTAPGSLAEEFRLQEALLRKGAPAVRVVLARERAVSYGIGVRPDAAYLARARALGVPAVPRTSGGSGLLHLVDDLIWAVVLPRSDPRVGRDFARAYDRLGRGVVVGLAAVGVRARWVAAPGVADDYCPLSSRGEVLATEARIVGGAAQHATSEALLHHGTVSWSVDREQVDRLFDLHPGGPSDRLGGVNELGAVSQPAAVAEAVARALNDDLGL
jgi:lipoate-protein ligase A